MGLVGRLEDLGISDIFQILGIGKKTGTLAISTLKAAAGIRFRDGLIIRADTSAFEGGLADDLVKAGLVKPSTLELALLVKKTLPEKSIIDILLELGAMKKEMLEKAARKRIEKAVFEVMNWQEGDFQFELDEEMNGSRPLDSEGWTLSSGLSPEYLLMEGARVHDESGQGFIMPETGEDAGREEDSGWDDDWGEGGSRKDISSLKALTQELRFPNSASEITLLILRFASDIFQRGVLFMTGPDEMAGLGQFGLDIENADERIRQIRLDFRESPFLSGIIKTAHSYRGAIEKDRITESLVTELGGKWPPEAAFFPLTAEGKVVALIYCDNVDSGGMPECEGLEIFISQAGLALEKALLQRRLQDFQKDKDNK
ncbi:MAG: DUF4388 domain-containing protein [Nitrospiraceae bacterium]|nr:DUF4388 domain-containing protein [Nitrospiraceae bacterium]